MLFKIKWNIVENGGWHFSYLMDAQNIQNKLKSFAHAEFNNEFYTVTSVDEKTFTCKSDRHEKEFLITEFHNLFNVKENNKMKNYTKIILSGGELKGFMILGALQYIYDNFD